MSVDDQESTDCGNNDMEEGMQLQGTWTLGEGATDLEQLWSLEGSAGIGVYMPEIVSLLCGKAVFLPPRVFTRVYMPYKVTTRGGVLLAVALLQPGLISGISVTKGGMIRLNVYNSTEETICLTPKTTLVVVRAKNITIKQLGKDVRRINSITAEDPDSFGERLWEEIMLLYPMVSDLSEHTVNEAMAKMVVKSSEVSWRKPTERGSLTQYMVENVANRRLVQ